MFLQINHHQLYYVQKGLYRIMCVNNMCIIMCVQLYLCVPVRLQYGAINFGYLVCGFMPAVTQSVVLLNCLKMYYVSAFLFLFVIVTETSSGCFYFVNILCQVIVTQILCEPFNKLSSRSILHNYITHAIVSTRFYVQELTTRTRAFGYNQKLQTTFCGL